MTVLESVRSLRDLGAFYTPPAAATFMADWLVDADGMRILEPSMGDGVFLRAIDVSCRSKALDHVSVLGVELAQRTFDAVVDSGLLRDGEARCDDFMNVAPVSVDGVIGNPPYVRLRNLPRPEADRARTVAERVLGSPMDPSGSLWMPFVLHAMEFLRAGGRLAFVLPYDFTYVRYARPLWRRLGGSFGRLRLVRVRERLFSDILQDVVLLFAADFGGSTPTVDYHIFESVDDLVNQQKASSSRIRIDAVQYGERPFLEAMLSPGLRRLLGGRLRDISVELGSVARFNIGYVTGHKDFFHPTPATIRSFGLSASSLTPAVTSARQLRRAGLFSSGLAHGRRNWLYTPAAGPLTGADDAYVLEGERDGVAERYKCRIRSPWWIVPEVRPPDLLVTVFGEEPQMIVNDANLVASNSLLCGYTRAGVDPRALAIGWYTPLAALNRELQIHALGGGVFVLVPREIARVRVPRIPAGAVSANGLDDLLRQGDSARAYERGRNVLRRALKLADDEIDLIDEGWETLSTWRKAASR